MVDFKHSLQAISTFEKAEQLEVIEYVLIYIPESFKFTLMLKMQLHKIK